MTRSLQDMLRRHAPERIAIVDGADSITYGALEAGSNRLARLLAASGCEPGDRVGVVAPKSIVAIEAFLATLKAGGVYVPFDPAGPASRVARMLERAGCRFILAHPAAAGMLGELAAELRSAALVWLGATPAQPIAAASVLLMAEAAELSAEPRPLAEGPDRPAHMLFTSGSTGIPKGVVVTHGNVLSFIDWANAYFRRGPEDRASCHSPLHFDLSTYDIFGSFAAGCELHLCPPELNLFPAKLVQFMRERELSHWFSAPSVLAYLARFDALRGDDLPALRELLWCGEVFPIPALRYWMERLPHVRFTNLYGPTETTIASSHHTMRAPPADDRADTPIGRACAGEEVVVLDDTLALAAPGGTGEICIAGAGVTLGYWQDEERTARAFPPVAAGMRSAGRMYRTGDLGRFDDTGELRFVGRADTQIKSRGHRIELGEIETALNSIPGVGQAVVMALPGEAFAGVEIGCAYVLRGPPSLDAAGLREQLGGLVPRYMLPSRWQERESLPINPNGKVDRPRLRAELAAQRDAGRS